MRLVGNTYGTQVRHSSTHIQMPHIDLVKGLEIEGDLTLSTAINSSLYYLLSSMMSYDSVPVPIDSLLVPGVSPGGLSTNDYLGHTFWYSKICQ